MGVSHKFSDPLKFSTIFSDPLNFLRKISDPLKNAPTGYPAEKMTHPLRVGLSHLRFHKKRHNFADTPSDKCVCRRGAEDTRLF